MVQMGPDRSYNVLNGRVQEAGASRMLLLPPEGCVVQAGHCTIVSVDIVPYSSADNHVTVN